MADVYRFRAFTLDPQRRAVLRDGSPIPVLGKAFDILLYLVEHPNRVVSKQDLMKAVWPDTIVEEANLTVNMSLLRKALGERDDDRMIVTVARQGYQFAANVTTESAVEGAIAAAPVARRQRFQRVGLFGSAGLVLLLIGVSIAWVWRHQAESPALVRVAVLPFENLTGDTSRNYLADALTDELITHLARLQPPRLGVIARTSVMQYKHNPKRLDQIGRDLSVGFAIESSLQQSANRLRVSVRLVRVADQRDVWASDFDYGPQDVLQIEDSVGAAVARAVRLRVNAEERSQVPGAGSSDPIAVDEVMRGRDLYHYADTKADWASARRYLLDAIARDSNYALAWTWLGAAYRLGAGRGYLPTDSGIPAGRAAVDRALVLDPDLPEAWEQRGQFERLVDWNWTAAAESYRHALALDPGGADAIRYTATIELTLGHFDKAIALFRRAIVLDPVNPLALGQLATAEYDAGHLDTLALLIHGLAPDLLAAVSKDELLDEYLALGRVADAEALVPLQAAPVEELRGRALVAHARGRRHASDSALALLIARYHEGGAYQIAEVYGFRGEVDSALAWLDRGYAARDQGLAAVMHDPLFASLHGDPRYNAFLTKMRLPPR